jgi:hypothetical protein
MKSLIGSLGLALCGLLSSVVVALADVFLERATGISVFGLTLWFVLPAGAVCAGIAAASGYYFGALYLDRRPTPMLLWQMVLVAAFAQFLIYYLSYASTGLEDGSSLSDVLSFWQYMDARLSTSRLRRIGLLTSETITPFTGYVFFLAAIQFLGFLAGGLSVYYFLRERPYCTACNLYLRLLATKEKFFPSSMPAFAYFNSLTKCDVQHAQFSELLNAPANEAMKPAYGAHKVDAVLRGCPACKRQLLENKMWAYNGNDWKVEYAVQHQADVPHGVDLISVFGGSAPLQASQAGGG